VTVPAPLVSVILPTFNRGQALELVLAAYERQVPAELPFELVVVDDGSTDQTPAVLERWSAERYSIRRARQDNAGPAAARNRALDMVRGHLVLFSGDDIEPAPDLLAQHVAAHHELDDPCVAVLGLTRWPDRQPLTATMRHIDGVGAQQFSYRYLEDGEEYDFRHLYTSNVSVRRPLLELEPSGFSTDFPAAAFEDAEYAYRLSGHGLRIVYRSAPVAYHHHHYDAGGFFRRQVRCGRMASIMYDMHPYLKRWCGVREVEWTRLRLLAAPPEHRHRVRELAADLDDWEARALSLACFLDPLESDIGDALLLPLFQYAFLKGVASSVIVDGDAATRVATELFLRLVPGAVAELAGQAAHDGVPLPQADLWALWGLQG
jgi:glycosyltransferase involved in cell wall biosynthesis